MSVIYHLVQYNTTYHSELFRSLEGAARAAQLLHNEYLFEKGTIYNNDSVTNDVTEDLIIKMFDDSEYLDDIYRTFTVIKEGDYYITISEVLLQD